MNPERKALGRLQAGKWESAFRLIQKSLLKNPGNIEANYVLARWYFASGNPSFQIDSASAYTNYTISLFDSLELREKERISRFPIDSTILKRFRNSIDSAAFDRARKLNTELTYQFFIDNYPSAIQIKNAIELRDEVSFLDALRINTFTAYNEYLQKYPQSLRAREASERYEKLLFEENTKDKSLNAYKAFVKKYPGSPYRKAAQREVFEISTASGTSDAFNAYLNENPDSPNRKVIQDLLFHVYKEKEEPMPEWIMNDSLRNVLKLDLHFWIPVFKNELYGFIDQTGAEMLEPQFEEMNDQYKCGPVRDDILSLNTGFFSRSGKMIAPDSVEIHSVGSGFLEVSTDACTYLIHKSGRKIIDSCFDEFRIIDNSFIAALRGGNYTLFTLTGRLLPLSNITDITEMEDLLVITRAGKKVINTKSQLAALAEGKSFYNELVFDEVKVVERNMLLVRLSGMEGILSAKLEYLVPLDHHRLTMTHYGLIVNKAGGMVVRGLSAELESKVWSYVSYHNEWLVLHAEGRAQLFHAPTRKLVENSVDSVWFDQKLAYVQNGSTRKVYLSGNKSIELAPDSKIHFITARDSVQFFFTTNKKKHTVFTLNKGEQLFATEYEIVESLGSEYFIVSKSGRKGVLGRNGKVVVPVEMDVIIVNPSNNLSLLKNKKFGLYDFQTRKLFKPEYDRNVIQLDKKNLVVYKNGFLGVVDLNARPVTDFEFTEVQPWSDSSVWVRKNAQWQLLNFYTKKVLIDRVQSFTWVKNKSDERIVKIYREHYYGIVTNKNGLIIPASFTEIINLGTPEEPLYFTEKYIEEAGIYIVVYYNRFGVLIRKQAYEEPEYERILCEDK